VGSTNQNKAMTAKQELQQLKAELRAECRELKKELRRLKTLPRPDFRRILAEAFARGLRGEPESSNEPDLTCANHPAKSKP